MGRTRRSRRIAGLVAVVAGAMIALAVPANAQKAEQADTEITQPAEPDEPPAESDETGEMEVMVVTASSASRKRSDLTNSIDVIGEVEIELQRYDNVPELLRHVPGLHMEQPGSRGGRSSIYMRGLDPNQTVILVDGIRMNDPNNNLGGSFDLSTLDTDNVEQIEIVRGPLSAVHGSDALAGAINV
ncbi:MAG: TonB-dependent receptor, partial [Deltaproteobacteria bacterium]|nr:TonB-dependent receptor [Deltaproteobacteria bacterium]